MYNAPCAHCGGYHNIALPSMAASNVIPKVYEDLLKRLHKGEFGKSKVDVATIYHIAEHLMEAVFTGYGKTFDDVAFNTPDYNMLASLERDVYSFSYAKNYQMLKALSGELKEGNRVRTYTEFRKEAAKVLDEWVGNWLRTEYDTAIGSAQMAARWVEYEQDADIIPLLEYLTAGDGRVRPAHQVLHGVIKPIYHAFWGKYYPPNGWGCRCDVAQAPIGKDTADGDIQYPDIDKMFETNLAKEGLAFPPGHPYFKGIPKDELSKYVLNLPEERQYDEMYRNGNGVVRQHKLVDTQAPDFNIVNQIAIDKADAGHQVEILPVIHQKELNARQTVFKGAKKHKNPDLRIDGVYTEVESPKTQKLTAISRRIKDGHNQADHVIINLFEDVPTQDLKNVAKGRFITHKGLERIEFEHNGQYRIYERVDLL